MDSIDNKFCLFVISILSTILLSLIVYNYYEKFFIKIGKNITFD